jgi:hypothetical protein
MDYTSYYQRLRGDMISAREIHSLELLKRQCWYDPIALDNLEKHKDFLLYSSQQDKRSVPNR